MQLAVSIFTIRTIEQRRMEVRRELQSTSESLHHAQARREQLGKASRAFLLTNPLTAHGNTVRTAASKRLYPWGMTKRIPRYKHSQRKRKRENKLSQRHIGNHVIHQMQRELVHFAANARTTNCAAFTGEPYETLVLVATLIAREAQAHRWARLTIRFWSWSYPATS
jgi:hypothetical protein